MRSFCDKCVAGMVIRREKWGENENKKVLTKQNRTETIETKQKQ